MTSCKRTVERISFFMYKTYKAYISSSPLHTEILKKEPQYCKLRIQNPEKDTLVDVTWDMNKGGKFLKKLWCCVGGKV